MTQRLDLEVRDDIEFGHSFPFNNRVPVGVSMGVANVASFFLNTTAVEDLTVC